MRMIGVILYITAVVAGLGLDQLTGQEGWQFWGHDPVELFAGVFLAVISISVVPEAAAAGFRSSRHWKSLRLANLMFWLGPGLVLRAFAVYYIASAWGMEKPGAVASGLLATDPAAVGLTLGLSPSVNFLHPLFWQMTVESLLNDAIGISAFGVATGQTLSSALSIIAVTLLHAAGLAAVMTIAKLMMRRRRSPAWIEVLVLLLIVVLYVGYAVSTDLSPILLTAVGSFVADLLEGLLPERDSVSEAELHHLWEVISQMFLAGILFGVTLLAPIKQMITDPRIVLAGFSLIFGVILSRFAADFGIRLVIRVLSGAFRNRFNVPVKWGVEYGLEGGIVNSFGGVPMLGVPSVTALELAAMGYSFSANSMLAAVLFSSAFFIPIGFLANQLVEERFSNQPENRPTWKRLGQVKRYPRYAFAGVLESYRNPSR